MTAFQKILNYYRPYWAIAVLSMALAGAFELLDLVVPYILGQLLNLLAERPLDGVSQTAIAAIAELLGRSADRQLALGVLVALAFAATVVRAPLQPWLSEWFQWAIPLRARRDRSADAVAKLLTLPLEFYDENNPGRIAGRIARGLANHTWSYPDIAGQLVPRLVRVVGIFIVMWVLEWRIAVLFFLSFAGILAFTVRGLKRLVDREQLIDRYIENTESRTSELVTNIKTVKAFATEHREYARQLQRFDREAEVIVNRVHRGYTILSTWQRTVVQSSMFLVLCLTLGAALRGTISLGHFVTLLTISQMAYSELEPISNMAEMFARRYASMLRFHEFLAESPGLDAGHLEFRRGDRRRDRGETARGVARSPQNGRAIAPTVPAAPADPAPTYRFQGKLEFDNLSFAYDRDRPVLQDIDLSVEPRQTVALVGRSGSGKSTLVKLLFRYFDPNDGAIRLDGLDIRQLDVSAYRRRLAIVHQEVDVFNGTLLDNLRYGNPNATEQEVAKACAIARADEFVAQLPDGYGTVVGERGLRLSGGQRQRLGIARALLVNPDVLVFDEATSSLDSESERAIQRAMGSVLGTRTTLVIAHRLSTIREADAIAVLDRGRIVEAGTHAELLSHGGLYHRLHQLQESGAVY